MVWVVEGHLRILAITDKFNRTYLDTIYKTWKTTKEWKQAGGDGERAQTLPLELTAMLLGCLPNQTGNSS